MKKLVFLIILFVISLLTFAQVTVRPGVKLGTNIATITNTDLDYKVGLQIGAFAIVRFGDLYAIQPEILYSRQGGKSRTDELNDIKINYLSIPITNKFYILPKNGFHLLVGPSFDFSVGDSLNDLSERPEYNLIDIALFAGVGYEFDFGLSLEARYKNGLINVDLFGDTDDERFNVGANVLNAVFQMAATYKFDF